VELPKKKTKYRDFTIPFKQKQQIQIIRLGALVMFLTNLFICSCSIFGILANQLGEKILVDINSYDIGSIIANDAKVSLSSDGNSIRIYTGHDAPWPGITIKNPENSHDLSSFKYIAIDVKNTGTKHVTINWRIDNPNADGNKNCITNSINVKPNEQKTLKVPLPRPLPDWLAPKLFGMRGYPDGLLKETNLDISNVTQFVIFVNRSSDDHSFEISNIRAFGTYTPPEWISMTENEFFPMIDEYGQFIHKDWKGKTHSKDDLAKHEQEEHSDIQTHQTPKNWNIYGGWEDGVQLTATGYFRVEKYDGKWWLVDPEGRLFWSHGIDCVGDWNGVTPITDREFYFRYLPEKDSPFGNFYGEASWAPHNYYEGKGTYRTYNFTASNLLRKYGENWREKFADITQKRLRSWGMNTIGNWSSDFIYNKRKTPYVVSIGFGGKLLEGSEGYWGKFRDVFDDSFEVEVKKSMSWQKDRSANDPWCLGYFVDNEISWGDEVSLSIATLVSPPDQPAKKVFIDDLKAKYGTIDKLNQIWGANYESWDTMLQSREAPDRKKAYEDLTTFYSKFSERYFKVCRDAVKEVAPNNLYLGCRFAWANDLAVKASAKYCDVISYNLYYRDIENVRLPLDIDMPVIIGEFHFGALDRGMFHTGLQATENQEDRANAYKTYVTGALKNPQVVGTHWFQYGDQATTGRGDGENYQIGFIDIVDTPYYETINACREVGYNMYKIRTEK